MMQDDDFNQKFSHHSAITNGVTLHYVIGGEGTPVLFPLPRQVPLANY
jgi:hypothetical protein